MLKTGQKVLLTAVVAGFLAGASLPRAHADDQGAAPAAGDDKKFECKGGNSCKGQGACGGPGHECAGKNSCIGKGYVHTKDQAECDARLAQVKQEMDMKKKGMKKKHSKKTS